MEGGYALTRSLTGPSTEPMRVDHVEGLQEGSLMHTGKGEEQLAIESSRVAEITDAERLSREMSTVAGNNKQERRENGMENETGKVGLVGRKEVENDMGQATKNKGMEVFVGGKVRKIKKWKSQARGSLIVESRNSGPISLKRPIETQERRSPECKRTKALSNVEGTIWSSYVSVKEQEEEEARNAKHGKETTTENAAAEAGSQPRRQP